MLRQKSWRRKDSTIFWTACEIGLTRLRACIALGSSQYVSVLTNAMAARFPPLATNDAHVSLTVQGRKSGRSRPTFGGQRGCAFGVSLNDLPTANHDPASSILGFNTHGCVGGSTSTAFWPSTFYNTPIVMPVSQFGRVPDTIHAYQWFQPCFLRMKGAERSIAMPPGCTVLLLIGSSASDRRKKVI